MEQLKVDPVIYENRPDNHNRPEKEIRTYDVLEQLKIPFKRLEHDPANTIESCQKVEEILQIKICKNLFLCNTQKTDFYLLLMPGEKKFKTSVLSKQLGTARLSFAPYEFMEEFMDITPGSVSIMGLINDKDKRIRLIIDEDVVKEEFLGCHPCINTGSLKIKTSDIINKFIPYTNHEITYVSL